MPITPFLYRSVRLLATAFLLVADIQAAQPKLHRAIIDHDTKAAVRLINAGEDVNQRDNLEASPLHYAVLYGDTALIEALLQHGAQINSYNRDGATPVLVAVGGPEYRNDIVQCLLKHGAKINSTDNGGRTPLMQVALRRVQRATHAEQKELIAMLLAAGANANLRDRSGLLAIHYAAYAGQPADLLTLFFDATTDAHAETPHGYDVYVQAVRGGQRETALVLAQRGFVPRKLNPIASEMAAADPLTWDLSYQVNGQAFEWYADYLIDKKNFPEAKRYVAESLAAYEAAAAEFKRASAAYATALVELKAGRRRNAGEIVFKNIIGLGLAATTGYGMVFMPGRQTDTAEVYKKYVTDHAKDSAAMAARAAEMRLRLDRMEHSSP